MTTLRKYDFEIEDGKLVGETDITYRFAESGVEISSKDLRKKQAGDRLAFFAREHMKRTGESYSDSLRVAMFINPEFTRDYFCQG